MSEIMFRRATRADVPVIVALLADDAINGHREKPGLPVLTSYFTAFDAIDKDASQTLIVGEIDGAVIATAQLSIIPTMTQQGTPRALIESVRVSSQARSTGIGEKLIAHLQMLAKVRGATAVQTHDQQCAGGCPTVLSTHRVFGDASWVQAGDGVSIAALLGQVQPTRLT